MTADMRRRSFLWTCGAAAVGGASLAQSAAQSLAQSPLGTLAWVEAGSLWVRDLPDGRAAKIATVAGLHGPRISPSGRWVLYQDHDERVSVVRRDGQAGAAIESEHAAWIPDDRLAAVQDANVVTYAAHSGWKTATPFLIDAGLPVFAPDGKQFVFTRDDSEGSRLVVKIPGSAERDLVVNEEGEMAVYGWTRDGKTILYWRAMELSASIWSDGVGLYSVAKGGGTPRDWGVKTLVDRDFVDLAPGTAGNRVALTAGGGRETWAGKRIAVMDLDTSASHDLSPENIAAFSPAWSPDARSIAYSAGPDADAAYMKQMTGVNIRLMRPDGSVETKPVGPALKVGVGGGEEAHVYLHQRKLWIMDATGMGTPRQLTSDARYRDESPMWSADGEHLLFGRMDYAGHASLWMMEASGADPRQVCKL
jgi:dipeptidyl aminopeptidase/acylaminoacyl peptidase